ncbi:MAG: hypothetical protein WB239_06735, partial [Acidimicrobiia bacterium]
FEPTGVHQPEIIITEAGVHGSPHDPLKSFLLKGACLQEPLPDSFEARFDLSWEPIQDLGDLFNLQAALKSQDEDQTSHFREPVRSGE